MPWMASMARRTASPLKQKLERPNDSDARDQCDDPAEAVGLVIADGDRRGRLTAWQHFYGNLGGIFG